MISVLVPVLNEEENIPEFMKCILAQKVRPEVVFADGGSKDNTISLIKKYAEDPKLKIKLLQLNKKGTGYAINEAFKASEGKYVLHAGADWRFIDPNMFEFMEKVAKETNADLIEVRVPLKIRPELGIIKNSVKLWDSRYGQWASLAIIKREFFPEYPNISYGEDKIAGQRLMSKKPNRAIVEKDLDYERGYYEKFGFGKFIKRYLWYGKTYNLYLNECKDPKEYLRIFYSVLTVLIPPLLVIPALVGLKSSLLFVKKFPYVLITFPVLAAGASFFMGIGYLLHFIDKDVGHL